jgi:hypothetical protein
MTRLANVLFTVLLQCVALLAPYVTHRSQHRGADYIDMEEVQTENGPVWMMKQENKH